MHTATFLRATVIAATLVATGAAASPALPAHADTIASDQAQAAQLVARINAGQQQLDQLAAQYEQAQQQAAALLQQSAALHAHLASTRARIASLTGQVRSDAVTAYMDGGGAQQGLAVLMQSSATQAALGQAYLSSVAGNANTSINALDQAEGQLHADVQRLHSAEAATTATFARMAAERAQARAATSAELAELAQVKGRVAALVAAQEAALAAANARNAYLSHLSQVGQLGSLPLSGQGGAAVREAQTYLGVPYQWGGASRSGVDCSGLTMLAWRAAGVNLPRTSEAQYTVTTPVPMSQIQPGDLVFYNGNSHVAMYAGNGEVIEALHTGTKVGYWPIGYAGRIDGVGRP